ncbi:RING finger protein 212B-like [Leucoraja erinacea]|uniref:RING finger protein 212B-like n=1 Tax=Leucoraja erinaceus TaxID=7782 RepID=UPI0024565EA9|nr:RING finger protein 212B-like [Leucoraja erinacea]
MDWFHCNKCYGKPAGATLRFSLSSCKHILCHKCVGQDKCSVCGSTCKYLPLSDNMAAHEQMYVRKPADICRKYLEHVAQVTTFQRKQMEMLLAFHKHKAAKMEEALREAHCTIRAQEKESMALKNQMMEMKKMLALTKASPNLGQARSRSATPRPIAITSPSSWATPKHTPQDPRAHSGSAPPSRPELMLQVSGSSVSRSGGLLMSRGSPATSGRSTPRDIIMSSPMAGSGDSSMYRSLGRSQNLLTIPLSQGQGFGDARLPTHSSATPLGGAYTTPLQLLGLNGGRQTPSVGSEPRRQIQLNTIPRSVIFRQPSVPFSRDTAV